LLREILMQKSRDCPQCQQMVKHMHKE
jgi:hypothetical protein